jgi:hypothetical protein
MGRRPNIISRLKTAAEELAAPSASKVQIAAIDKMTAAAVKKAKSVKPKKGA